MKAVVLAAGEGTRLQPLTNVRPKPMLPIANRPLLEHVVEAVAEAGIDEIVLVVGYKRERIQSHFEDGDDWGVDIEYAVQDKQLGTGHAILQVEDRVDDEFVVLNGDRVIEPTVVEEAAADDHRGDLLVAVTRVDSPSNYGVVEVADDRVVDITEKPPRHVTESDIINAGVYRFDQDVFDAIRATEADGELEITATLDRIAGDRPIRPLRYRGLWLDVTHLWDVIGVNASLLDRASPGLERTATVHESAVVSGSAAVGADSWLQPGAAVIGGSAIGDNVSVGPNAVLDNVVVFSDATIGAGAVLRDCVVAENARVGPNATAEGDLADVVVNGTLHEDVRLGGVIGDNARLGGGVSVAPGAVIGNGATVQGGAAVDGRIPPRTEVRRG